MRRPSMLWGGAGLLYLAFCAWYTNLSGPLTSAEVERYLERMAGNGADVERLAQLRAFLEEDTGDDFIMVNAILTRERPLEVKGVPRGESSQEVLARYMAYMWPALLKRACHPILAGPAVSDALETWGLENGERWSDAALMRYRSRRDLMEIVTHPEFSGPHEFKIAAIEKTVAFPIEPLLQLGEPRLLLGLILFAASAGLHLLLRRPGPGFRRSH